MNESKARAIGVALGMALFVAVGLTLMIAARSAGDLKPGPIDPKVVKYWLDRGLDRRIALLLFFSAVEIIETRSAAGPIHTIRIANSPREAAEAIKRLPPADVARFEQGERVEIVVQGGAHALEKDDLVVHRHARGDLVVQTDGEVVAALDATLTDDLREEGLARDYLRINGAWADHLLFAILASDRRPRR